MEDYQNKLLMKSRLEDLKLLNSSGFKTAQEKAMQTKCVEVHNCKYRSIAAISVRDTYEKVIIRRIILLSFLFFSPQLLMFYPETTLSTILII